jgi:hypothetical protein
MNKSNTMSNNISNNISNDILDKFSNKHANKFLKGHATKPVIKYNSLKNAMENAIKNNRVGGITQSKNKKYTLRKNSKLQNSPSGESSWIKKSKKSDNIRLKWKNVISKVIKSKSNKKKQSKQIKRQSNTFKKRALKNKALRKKMKNDSKMWRPSLSNINENNTSNKSNSLNTIKSNSLNTIFTKEHKNKYLKGHATKPVVNYYSLNNAMKKATNNDTVHGITKSKVGKFTLRKGNKLLNSPSNESSWLKLDKTESNLDELQLLLNDIISKYVLNQNLDELNSNLNNLKQQADKYNLVLLEGQSLEKIKIVLIKKFTKNNKNNKNNKN